MRNLLNVQTFNPVTLTYFTVVIHAINCGFSELKSTNQLNNRKSNRSQRLTFLVLTCLCYLLWRKVPGLYFLSRKTLKSKCPLIQTKSNFCSKARKPKFARLL